MLRYAGSSLRSSNTKITSLLNSARGIASWPRHVASPRGIASWSHIASWHRLMVSPRLVASPRNGIYSSYRLMTSPRGLAASPHGLTSPRGIAPWYRLASWPRLMSYGLWHVSWHRLTASLLGATIVRERLSHGSRRIADNHRKPCSSAHHKRVTKVLAAFAVEGTSVHSVFTSSFSWWVTG